MIDDIIDTVQDALAEAFTLETFLSVLIIVSLISIYFGMDLPGSRQVRRFVGISPRDPTGGGGSSSG